MLEKEFKLNTKTFKLLFTHKPFYDNENTLVMGFPYNQNIENFPEDEPDKVKGYFFYFKFKDNKLKAISDICGMYRVYYLEKGDTTYFSNDFFTLFNLLDKNERHLDKFELEYWKKHRYTTGKGTVCKEIKKIMPAHIYEFSDEGIKKELYFKNTKNVPNRKKHFENVLTDLRETISIIKKMPQKKLLLFSGGVDSTLVLHLLKEQNVEFTPVFGVSNPPNNVIYDDILKVLNSAKKLGIEPEEVETDSSQEFEDKTVDLLLMDRNAALIIYNTIEAIKKKYGEDVIIITGQCSDSILNFGPTNKGFRFDVSRHFLFKPFSLLNKIFFGFTKLIYPMYKNCNLAKNKDEFLRAFFDDISYVPVIDNNKDESYLSRIKEIVSSVKEHLKEFYSRVMYLKIFGFIQGSDDFLMVQSTEFGGGGCRCALVFASPKIIYSTIENTDFSHEIMNPKSVNYEIMKKVFGYEMPKLKKKTSGTGEDKKIHSYKKYEKFMYQKFYKRMESLFSSQ